MTCHPNQTLGDSILLGDSTLQSYPGLEYRPEALAAHRSSCLKDYKGAGRRRYPIRVTRIGWVAAEGGSVMATATAGARSTGGHSWWSQPMALLSSGVGTFYVRLP